MAREKQNNQQEIDRQAEIDATVSEDKIADQSELIKQLMAAAKSGDQELVENLITKHNVDVNCFDSVGKTALHYASKHGQESVVRILLILDADINIQEKNANMSPLILAISYNQYSVVKQLLSHNSNCYLVSHRDGDATPLEESAFNIRFNENWDMVRLLLQTHKKLNVQTKEKIVTKIQDAFLYAVDMEYAKYSCLGEYENIVDQLDIPDLQ